MSTRRAAPGVFELQRSNSHREAKAVKSKHARDEENARESRSGTPRESEYEEEVDESVREDMAKLEDTFPGISDRFRLVNRIGEGISEQTTVLSNTSILTRH